MLLLTLLSLTDQEFVQRVTVDKGPGGPDTLYNWCLQDLGVERMPKEFINFSGFDGITSHREAYLHYTLFPFPTPEELSFGDVRDTLYFQAIQYDTSGNVFSGLGIWAKWPMTQPAFERFLREEVDLILGSDSTVKYLLVDNEPDHMWYRVVKGFPLLTSIQTCPNI